MEKQNSELSRRCIKTTGWSLQLYIILNKVLSYSLKQPTKYTNMRIHSYTYTEQAWENPQIFFKRIITAMI